MKEIKYYYVNPRLEKISVSNTRVYKNYLQLLSLNDLRRIFNYYYSSACVVDVNCVLDTKSFYISKILELFDYDKNLF